MTRPGPKLDHLLGPVSKRHVMLDDLTVTMAQVLGANLSDGIRRAVRVAYDRYQATTDAPAPAAESGRKCSRPRCDGDMLPGIAMGETFGGVDDFPGCGVVTVSPRGPGHLVQCLKCNVCGHSVRATKRLTPA